MTEYIKREAVHNLVQSLTKYAWASPDNTGHRVTVDADDVNFGVDKIPSADVAEVVHGRWVPTKAPFMNECEDCCVCGYRTVWGHRYNYCPNCGAKMDGVDDG